MAHRVVPTVSQIRAETMIRFVFKRKGAQVEPLVRPVLANLDKRSLVLVGLMGCGKTSVGRRLATALNVRFVDADEEIERSAHKSVADIFADHGEQSFRDGERRVIERLLREGPQVLATGGGAYMNATTRDNIKAHGISIWLKADLPVLMKRVMRRDNRPLLQTADPEATMRRLMTERYPVYAGADLTIESREVPHDEMVNFILRGLLAGPLGPHTGPSPAGAPDATTPLKPAGSLNKSDVKDPR
jgi:shikimate kinase